MTGLVAAIPAKIAESAVFSRAGAFFGNIPPKVWLALGCAVAAILGVLWHHHEVKAFGDAQFAAGQKSRDAQIQSLQNQLQSTDTKLADAMRRKNDETNTRIITVAHDVLVRGPGRAGVTCPPAASGGHIASSGNGDATGSQVPSDDRAAVPWNWLVDRAQQADLNRAEVLSWRDWYKTFDAQWKAYQAKAAQR